MVFAKFSNKPNYFKAVGPLLPFTSRNNSFSLKIFLLHINFCTATVFIIIIPTSNSSTAGAV